MTTSKYSYLESVYIDSDNFTLVNAIAVDRSTAVNYAYNFIATTL